MTEQFIFVGIFGESFPLAAEMVVGALVPGSQVWIRDTDEVWIAGEIIRSGYVRVKTFATNTASEIELKPDDIVHLRNIDPLTGEDVLTDDLVNLAHLHEPALLHVLQERFLDDQIYTFTGSILLAVNPFKNIPHLYSPELMHSYLAYEPYVVEVECLAESGRPSGRISVKIVDQVCLERISSRDLSNIPSVRATISKKAWVPSTFATAARAYKGIMDNKKSQVILISGESGSGKTETTKHVMKFLVQAGPLLQCNVGSGGKKSGTVGDRRKTNWDKVRRTVQSLGARFEMF